MESSYTQADDYSAENAGLQCGYADVRADGAVGESIDGVGELDEGAHGGVHYKECDNRGKSRHGLLVFGHTDGHSYGEKQGKVVKHHRAAVVEHGQQGVKNRALAEDGRKPVGFYHCRVGERPAYAKEQPCHGKYGYGEHKGSADTLQYAENLVFLHINSS